MHDQDGKTEGVSKILRDVRDREAALVEALLPGWRAQYPKTRLLLLGLWGDSPAWRNVSLRAGVSGTLFCVTVWVRTLRIEALYSGATFESILEQMENDLDCDSVPWRQDWRSRQSEERRIEKALDVSS